MTAEQKLKPPTPQIQHLPTILRRDQAGELRVPAFQRGYVWDDKQIRELLQSVYKGYPIGSLLFWNTSDVRLTVEAGDRFPFPSVPDQSPVAFVLDGMQRLATLYNCFFPVDPKRFPQFNVVFDLRTLEFFQAGKNASPEAAMPLSSLFSPREFLAAQRRLEGERDADVLLDRAIALHSKFQEYTIPTVTIEGRTIAEVVEIFERVNNTGTKLSAVDFMRAVTWSEGFDLTLETGRLRTRLKTDGFRIPQETLVKIVAIALGREPNLEEMLRLRGTPARTLAEAVSEAEGAIRGAIAFFRDSCRIYSYDYVPYEAQLLVLCKLFLVTSGSPGAQAKESARRWFWATSFNEGLQGKAESVVAGLLKSVESLASGDSRAFDTEIQIEAGDMTTRLFIAKRSAISCALGALLAFKRARSVVTGNEIPAEEFMSEFSLKSYYTVFSTSEFDSDIEGGARTAKLIPNMIVVSRDDRSALKGMGDRPVFNALSRLSEDRRKLTLESQAISAHAYRDLAGGRPIDFLVDRSEEIIDAARAAV